jgi:hypothetical protein
MKPTTSEFSDGLVAKHCSGESWADAWIVAVAIAPLAMLHERER